MSSPAVGTEIETSTSIAATASTNSTASSARAGSMPSAAPSWGAPVRDASVGDAGSTTTEIPLSVPTQCS